MKNIELFKNNEITEKLDEFENFGGLIDIKVFKVYKSKSEYDSHFLTAKNTMLEVQKHSQLKDDFNENKIKESGIKISREEFFGPYFNFKILKPIVGGDRDSNSRYYFDSKETSENKINIKDFELYKNNTSDLHTIGFAQAFLEPPHGLDFIKKLEKGIYFIDFCEFLFSDLNKIEVYKWNTDCSNYFDSGKEWWGTHFWTVYNPVKKYYIGFIASTTD